LSLGEPDPDNGLSEYLRTPLLTDSSQGKKGISSSPRLANPGGRTKNTTHTEIIFNDSLIDGRSCRVKIESSFWKIRKVLKLTNARQWKISIATLL